jgi:hypothetical protein
MLRHALRGKLFTFLTLSPIHKNRLVDQSWIEGAVGHDGQSGKDEEKEIISIRS